MKTYKIIVEKQKGLGITGAAADKFATKVEALINEKCRAGWELVDISWIYNLNVGMQAYLTFRY